MRAVSSADEARRRFAEETDASADLGRAPDAAERMAVIHARHQASLARLGASDVPPLRQTDEKDLKNAEV